MKTNFARITTATLLFLCACSKQADEPVKAAPPPSKTEVVKKMELLTAPKEDVIHSKRTAAEFPELKIKTLKPGEGENSLDWGEAGVFQIKGHLASGKEFKNTNNAGTPEEIVMMEWGDIQGLVLGAIGMKPGEIRTMRIPPELGYGKRGDAMQGVQPHGTLFLRVELEDIKNPLAEGFQVRRKKAGTGDPIRAGQSGRFHYTGVLAEGDRAGEQFDSSQMPGGSPIPVLVGPQGQVIEGWRKGLLGMRVGEQRWLRIPAKMGYGAGGSGDNIPPNSPLIFEVVLESVDG